LFLTSALFQFVSALTLSNDEKKQFVDAHNKWRREADPSMPLLKWNDDLAKFADTVSARCKTIHSTDSERTNLAGFKYVGENIFASVGQPKPKPAVDEWGKEIKYYIVATEECVEKKVCGHYKQVIAYTTTDVGCVIAKCDQVPIFKTSGYVVVCNYASNGKIVDPNKCCAKFFLQENFVQQSSTMCKKWNVADSFSDRMKSVKVDQGCVLEVYSKKSWQGDKKTMTGQVASLKNVAFRILSLNARKA